MKKILALIICLQLILLSCVSCGTNTDSEPEIDYTKFYFPGYDSLTVRSYLIPYDEETYNEYYDDFIKTAKGFGVGLHDYYNVWILVCFKGSGIEDGEYWGDKIDYSGVQVRIKMDLSDIDSESIAKIALDDRVAQVVFLYSNTIVFDLC